MKIRIFKMFPVPNKLPGLAELPADHPGHKLDPNPSDGLAKLAAYQFAPDHPAMNKPPYDPNIGLAVAPG
jgi:hypothetical protein